MTGKAGQASDFT